MTSYFNKNQFGKRLAEIRKAKGMTQEAVCDKANLDVSNYCKMEKGKVMPSMPSLYKIVKGADFNPNDLFNYEHLENEKTLDEMNMKIYNSLSLQKKRGLYKILRALEELI